MKRTSRRFTFGTYITLVAMVLLAFFIEDQLPTYILPGNPFTSFGSARLGDAQHVRATIRQETGDLIVSGGAEVLVQGDAGPGEQVIQGKFRYNVAEYNAAIAYTVQDGVGELRVDHGAPWFVIGERKVVWDIRLNAEVPFELAIEHAGGVALLDLSQGWYADAVIHIDGDTVTARFPDSANVELAAEADDLTVEGLTARGNSYVFDAGDPAAPILRVRIEARTAATITITSEK